MEIAIASGPWRTMAGRMKLHSGGTSTTLTSIARRSASSKTRMFTVGVVGRRDGDERALRRPRARRCAAPSGSSPPAQLAQLGDRRGRHEHHASPTAGEQALDLLQADVAAAHDEAAPPRQAQAGDVEGGCRASPARSSGRRSLCGAGRRTPCRRRPGRAWPLRVVAGLRLHAWNARQSGAATQHELKSCGLEPARSRRPGRRGRTSRARRDPGRRCACRSSRLRRSPCEWRRGRRPRRSGRARAMRRRAPRC